MSTPLNFLQASVRADELVARQNIGIGTDTQSSELHIKADAPEIRLEDRVGAAASETATRIYADSGNTYIQSGVNFTNGSSSNIVFGSMGNTTEFVNIGAHGIETTGNLFVNNLQFTQTQGLDQILNVSNTTSNIMTLTNTSDDALNVAGGITMGSNLAVNTDNLFVDTQAGRVGVGTTDPGYTLDVAGTARFTGTVTTPKFSFDTNGTLTQIGTGASANYIKLMSYFGAASNWKIATGSYGNNAWQWINIRAKMTRLDIDVKIIEFNFYGNVGVARVRDSKITGGGGGTTQSQEIKVYTKTGSIYEIYLQIDSATSVEVEISHRLSTIDSTYSTVVEGAIDETGLTKIYDSSTTADFRMLQGNVGIGTTNPAEMLTIHSPSTNVAALRIRNKLTAATDTDASYAHTNLRQKGAIGTNDRHLQIESYPYGGANQRVLECIAWNSTNDGWLTPMTLTNTGNLTISGTYSPSDDRLKTNEVFLENATETLLRLKPQKYDKHSYSFLEVSPEVYSNVVDGNVFIESTNTWVDANTFTYSETDDVWYKRTLSDNTHEEAGLIAQDIWYDAPELRYLVSVPNDAQIPETKPDTSDDPTIDPDYETWGRKNATVNYTYLIPYIIKSNQEIYAELQAEKAKTATLETQLASVLARLDALESA